MALDEAMRHRIHGRFEELLGAEEAAALMTAITDTDTLAVRIERSMTELATALRTEMNQQYRWTVQWVVGTLLGSLIGAGSLGLAIGRLLG